MSRPTPPPELGRAARRRRNRRLVQYILVFVGCVFLLDAIVGERGIIAMLEARREYRMLEQATDALAAENARLLDEVRRLQEDAGAIEEVAREALGLVKPGEQVFILREQPAGPGGVE